MDDSDTRRGRQTLHRQIATRYPTHPASEQFGRHTAILLGDLILGWSYELVHGAELDPARASRVWLLLNAMRTETLSGQYLDLLSTGVLDDDMEGALTVATYKTAKYTVERPLQLGSILAGAGQEMLDTWTAYGIPVGEAFQLRDDLLGVFADPADTGKSAIDDLRDGKHTVLLALAWKRADADQRSRLRALIGNPDLDETHAAEIRHIFTVTGSRATVEEMIVHRYNAALAALQAAQLPAEDDAVLRELATRATQRGH
ncbi:geranylgeranyl diphosphate synthase type I [Saccharopolyspora phatthalungensis]|uniref:Geranylgeranyl diphosphate synthase type I n=2 Tax=Saccharopolyspora phatthalungensis TaxID=664693 RepID=A0A840QI69_9PSEU|nr:geranylgeranyl diphosphate synthase type I [Saccharopolyspora phatthalungensis]